MKDLPPDPPVWTPPPERWFDRHEHNPADMTPAALTRTLSAMWMTLHDRMRIPLPTKARNFTVTDFEMLRKLISKLGTATMLTWRMACNYAKKDETPEEAFRNLLAAKGLYDE